MNLRPNTPFQIFRKKSKTKGHKLLEFPKFSSISKVDLRYLLSPFLLSLLGFLGNLKENRTEQ
uniref:Uncharacterized protein n=1 Tax=Rhizophora mucronata TaxID=61149 RepID=A0A2P2LEB9_RHIMU